jgi:acyl-CoA thioesterase
VTHPHPFAALLGFTVSAPRVGASESLLAIGAAHLNPHGVAHGAVLYALADTGMGAALVPTLCAGEMCATIQITMHYFKPVALGSEVCCRTELVNRGRRVAHLESRVSVGDQLVATAAGSYAIFTPAGADQKP